MSFSTFYFIILATAFLYCLHFSIAGTNETDKLALLEIKAKISSDPLGVMNSWNDTIHFCKWHGITCHLGRRVKKLELYSSKLTGFLSPSIGNLSFLKVLYLYNNTLGGTIPPEIGRLHRLQYLWLFNNTIEGHIPPNISACSRLTQIDISSNRLVGKIPSELSYLVHLKFLDLNTNKLTGTIPSSLGNLSSLSKINLISNNLNGNLPESLGKLKKLTYLSLVENMFSGIVPSSIFNLTLLTHFDIGLNKLEGNLPSDLGITLPNLQWFSISTNNFTGSIPTSISNCSGLSVLLLGSNNLMGQVPSLHRLVHLSHLTLYDNTLGYGQASDLNFAYSLANATELQYLDIGGNILSGNFPRIFCNLSMLFSLVIDDNHIGGQIPACIENLKHLTEFKAFDNQLSGVIPPGIGKLHNLNKLGLFANQFSGKIPFSIGNLTKMTGLSLSSNNLVGQIPSTLGNCKNLLLLDLSFNHLRGKIPSQLFDLSTLSIALDLSLNKLSGSLPIKVGQLKNLGWLDVSNNMLSGQIPSSLGSCMSLEYLYMRENYFQGTIPDTLSLKGLVELNLSYNNLFGKIPQFLQRLKLQSLDLSNNNLEGEVPIDGVFKNASGVYVSGNNKLCGGIPELKLPLCSYSINNQKRRLMHRKKVLIVAILSGFLGVILVLAFLVLLYIFWQKKRTKKPTASDDSENFPNLSYQTLLKATNGFSSDNLIGSGTFGAVYKGVLEEHESTVAIKVFQLQNHGAFKSFIAECGVLRNIRHRNLLKVVTACSSVDYQGRDFKALVYEYMANGSLDDWLHPPNSIIGVEEDNNGSRHLSLRQRLDIAVDVAFSLEYLHHHCGSSIVHCDLKPSNVLLDDEMVAHVGDFGLAKFLSKGINDSNSNESSSIGVRGTIGYAPPEYGVGNEVSTSGDVYSFGILLLEMITGKRPTDDMFKEGLTLYGFVKEALPGDVIKILDRVILEHIDCPDSNLRLEALTSILETALSCTTEIPAERLDMSDVAAKLSSIKNKLLGTRLQQRRRMQAGNVSTTIFISLSEEISSLKAQATNVSTLAIRK